MSDDEDDDIKIEIEQDTLNEEIVIAAALYDEDARGHLVKLVKPSMFADTDHASIWEAIEKAQAQDLVPTSTALVKLSGGKIQKSDVMSLKKAHTTTPPNVLHHAGLLTWDYQLRTAVNGPISDFLKAIKDPTTSQEKLIAVSRKIPKSLEGGAKRFLVDPSVAVNNVREELKRRRSSKQIHPFGIEGLDKWEDDYEDQQLAGEWRLIPGAAPGKVTVVTGLSGSGKSTFTARIVLGLIEQGRKVCYGAWEMQDVSTNLMLAAMSLGWSRKKVEFGDMNSKEEKRFLDEVDRINSHIRYFINPFGKIVGERYDVDRALDIVHEYLATSGCDVAVFDLWDRLLDDDRPGATRKALFRQQAIFDELKVHGIMLAQQRLKDIETRADRRPTREGILGASAWVDIADTIIGVHRPGMFRSGDDNVVEIDILKQRYGKAPIAVEFDWNPEFGSLMNARTIPYDLPNSEQLKPGKKGGGTSAKDFLGGKR
jgi:replicative DNA helicase